MLKKLTYAIRDRALAGLIAGVLTGVILSLLISLPVDFWFNLVISAFFGLLFGLIFGWKIKTVGASLVWGEAVGLLWWFVGWLTLIPLLSGQGLHWTVSRVQQEIPHLLGQAIGGAILGLSYYFLACYIFEAHETGDRSKAKTEPERMLPTAQNIVPVPIQAVIVGGLGGLLGSWVFVRGIETVDFFPLVAGLVGSDLSIVGLVVHYLIGGFIGITFGLLFHRDVQGAGPGLVWGMSYGLLWWILGPLTLMPFFLNFAFPPDWSLTAVQNAVPSLVAHLLYGALIGLFYVIANKIWRVLFIESDPLNRGHEGVGARSLRNLMMGQAGGLVGGLLFTIVMLGIGALPQIASLIGADSAFAGFVVHLIVSFIIGSSYGLLFQREAYSYGSGLAWGLVYGLLWWLLGALTLFPILLRQPVDWSLAAVVALYPSLLGHLLYGAGLGLFFQFLARRYDVELSGRRRRGTRDTRFAQQANRLPKRRAAGTPASALWVITLMLGLILPLLVSL